MLPKRVGVPKMMASNFRGEWEFNPDRAIGESPDFCRCNPWFLSHWAAGFADRYPVLAAECELACIAAWPQLTATLAGCNSRGSAAFSSEHPIHRDDSASSADQYGIRSRHQWTRPSDRRRAVPN